VTDAPVIVLSGTCDGSAAVASAASMAGACGVLDLTYAPDLASGQRGIEDLARSARGEIGVKLDTSHHQSLLCELPPAVRLAILVPSPGEGLANFVSTLRQRSIRVYVEVTSVEEANRAEALDLDGLIAKGHEAGGRVGEASTFILLQQLTARRSLPVWAHGGVGLHTVAGCRVAGAAGVVLDSQLLLARESRLSEAWRGTVARFDGSETTCVAGVDGELVRGYAPPRSEEVRRLAEFGERLRADDGRRSRCDQLDDWRAQVRAHVGWNRPAAGMLPIGQDIAQAARLAARHATVQGIVHEFTDAGDEHLRAAHRLRSLAEGAPLARSHGTRYPIVQGPMTRVSDCASFAARVAQEGALPFLALALLRRPEVTALLERTRDAIGDHSWGVGILGFVPNDIRQEQLAVIREHRPSFAIIAGGRPDQALSLETQGIPTYLHVPSPGLLELFLRQGARRFVFEGRECSGHVGPRPSLVLWDTMTELLLESLTTEELAECRLLFAGGIHDSISAAAVAATAAPLASRGAEIGVLMGTAYLFTEEAVSSGAIVPGFQQQALRCEATVLLESGPGHATRCVRTPFADAFRREKARLLEEGRAGSEVREALEELNLGRLRVASKGLERVRDTRSGADGLCKVSEDEQEAHGMYMIGDVASLRHSVVRLAELHHEVSVGSAERLAALAVSSPSPPVTPGPDDGDVAIIGMACVLPQAPDLATYWRNILHKVDAIREVPEDRWDWRRYFDPDPTAPDRVYSRWGGFLDDVPFDPTRWGIPPSAMSSIEPLQLLALHVADAAIEDAGYATRPFPRERTSVILGVGGGIGDLGQRYVVRSELPRLFDDVSAEVLSQLPTWTEDTFPGILLNVSAGRIANRLDLGGLNYTVDAACASSLAAIYLGAQELRAGTSDMVIVGGADTVQSAFAYLCFSKTQALSPNGRCRPFDADADGIAISEGVAMIVLKRLSDAERNGDRVYAIFKGAAGSSDGRALGLTAPRPEGQARALERAYAQAGVSPATIGLVEAHGTGTVAGDLAEAATMKRIFEAAGAAARTCALGSVKSMIGHTKCTAGVAGLIKAALALHHRVLPPTINVDAPNPKVHFEDSPLYVNSELRPWIAGVEGQPRRAGVSAFGFGGTNFHVVLEEHADDLSETGASPIRDWPSELFVFAGASHEALIDTMRRVERALGPATASPELRDVAHALWQAASVTDPLRVAVVASSQEKLRQRLLQAEEMLTGSSAATAGVHVADRPFGRDGRVAFVFPGQGSQYPGMFRELAVYLDDVSSAVRDADRILADRLAKRLSAFIYPPPCFSSATEGACAEELTQTNVAQPALGAVTCGLLRLLSALEIQPDAVAGHSYGEYVALHAAGVFSEDVLWQVSEARGRSILDASTEGDLGTMVAVGADHDRVAAEVAGFSEVWIANLNTPRQTVVSGTASGIERVAAHLHASGLSVQRLPVGCAFHSPLMEPARERLAKLLEGLDCETPTLPVYSNATGECYPRERREIKAMLVEHLTSTVRFAEEVQAMHRDGVRVFLEVGPRSVLTGMVNQILLGRPGVAVGVDTDRDGLNSLLNAVGTLWAHGVSMNLDRLFAGRCAQTIDLGHAAHGVVSAAPASTTWLVNGGSARPLGATGQRSPVAPTTAANDGEAAALAPSMGWPAAVGGVPSPVSAAADDVMIGFQRLMTTFLETQRRVMMSYLNGGGGTVAPDLPVTALPSTSTPAASPRVDLAPGQAVPLEPTVNPRTGDRGTIVRRLIELVAERTGYPAEVLDLDVDLASELGVDSIKRVEIIGALLQTCAPPTGEGSGEVMERLTASRTMREIADRVLEVLGPSLNGDHEPQPATPVEEETRHRLPRFTMMLVETALPEGRPEGPSGPVIITDGGRGIAHAVADAVRARGVTAVVCSSPPVQTNGDGVIDTVDLGDANAVASFVDSVRLKHGPIGGIIHLAPLRPCDDVEEMDDAAWHAHLRNDVRALHNLARASAADLVRAERSRWLVAATQLGGSFGFGVFPSTILPGSGGVAGLVKALAREWPGIHARVIDTELGAAPKTLADHVLVELFARDAEVEVGYRDGRRHVPRVRHAPLANDEQARAPLDTDSVVLVLGGGRGITARITRHLAYQYQPRLVIVGRSPWPGPESAETANIVAEDELKAALVEGARTTGPAVRAGEIEKRYRQIVRGRELVVNIDAMRRAGAIVTYRQADVRDATALANVIDEIYQEHGRLDGVIHGAGVIDDKWIADKTDASFDVVFDTKVSAARTLLRVLRGDGLRFVAFLSSTAGRFGNRGQSDYAAANETMSKLSLALARRVHARIVSIHWGPWRGAGMATPEVQRRFEAERVELVEPDAGVVAFDRELHGGTDAEVILGNGPWALSESASGQATSAVAGPRDVIRPFAVPSLGVAGEAECAFEVVLDPATDHRLDHHRLDGKPVVPAAYALAMMAQVAASARPGLQVAAVEDLAVLRGIVLDGGADALRVSCEVTADDGEGSVEMFVIVAKARQPSWVHYRGTVSLRPSLDPILCSPPASPGGEDFPISVDQAYADWLFHGPSLQCIRAIVDFGECGITAVTDPITTPDAAVMPGGPWPIDPVVIDAVPQLVILWSRAKRGVTALPSRLGRYRHLGPLEDRLQCHVQVRPGNDASICVDAWFVDREGRVRGHLEALTCTATATLNRLGGAAFERAEAAR
jgi:acyl transferase domain-containing protein/NAD(P)H-dependent flavin oxidoreductase YrpB (nitropropane dioxygenase family)/NADP-dependent 3-hydroxy acid dehydrogenase YdfG